MIVGRKISGKLCTCISRFVPAEWPLQQKFNIQVQLVPDFKQLTVGYGIIVIHFVCNDRLGSFFSQIHFSFQVGVGVEFITINIKSIYVGSYAHLVIDCNGLGISSGRRGIGITHGVVRTIGFLA